MEREQPRTTQEANPSLTLDCDLLKCLGYQVYGALATSAGVFAVEVGKLLTKVKRQIIFYYIGRGVSFAVASTC